VFATFATVGHSGLSEGGSVLGRFGDAAEAERFVRGQLTRAAQATFPFGHVMVVPEERLGDHGPRRSTMVAARDAYRPYDCVVVARAAAAELTRLGWQSRVTSEGRSIEFVRAERDGCLIEVFCHEDDDVVMWIGYTPYSAQGGSSC
jgi:porphobilinogen deaminase